MVEFIQFLSTVLIMIGLGADVFGAFILIKSSNKFSGYVMNQMNRTTNEKVEDDKKDLMEKLKYKTNNGVTLLLWGFVVQIIGYFISLEIF